MKKGKRGHESAMDFEATLWALEHKICGNRCGMGYSTSES